MEPTKPFNKRLWIILFSAAYLSLAAAITFGVRHAMQSAADIQAVQLGESANVAMARGLSQSLWPRFGEYVMTVEEKDGEALQARPETAQIDAATRQAVAELPVLKLKMFNRAGLTVYSSQASQIGDSKHQNTSFLGVAKHGVFGSKMSFRPEFNGFSGKVTDVFLVETYAPIIGADKSVEGVFELYTDVTDTVRAVYDRVTQTVWLVCAGLALGYFVLILILSKALTRSGNYYHARVSAIPNENKLNEHNEKLQIENAQLKSRLEELQGYIAQRSSRETADA